MSERKVEKLFSSITNISDDVIEGAQSVIPKRQSFSWLKIAVVAACLCTACFALFFGMANSDNTFVVKAYALGEMDDGTIKLIESDLINQPDVWGGHFDGENFYVNIGLRYEGNNIKSVEFVTEKGFFAKQYIDKLTIGKNVCKLYVGADNRLVMYGTEFDIVGNVVTLNSETMTDDLLIFWGMQATKISEIPRDIEICAIATFYDGQKHEVPISIDLSGTGAFTFTMTDEDRQLEIQRSIERKEYYKNLPLEKCELIEESVKIVSEIYEIILPSGTSWLEIHDDMEFDESGIYRGGIRGSGVEIYIPVIKRDVNGVYTGMLYRVPEDLRYNPD